MTQILASQGPVAPATPGSRSEGRIAGAPETFRVQTRILTQSCRRCVHTEVGDALTQLLSIWLHRDKEYNDAIKSSAFQPQEQAFCQAPQLLKLKGKKWELGSHKQPLAVETLRMGEKWPKRDVWNALHLVPTYQEETQPALLPAKRRGASLSRAISGGSRSTVLSFSVTMPW